MKYLKLIANAIGVKAIYKLLRNRILKLQGLSLLNIEQTAAYMLPYQVKVIAGSKAMLPQVLNCDNGEKNIFEAKESITDQVYVWDHQSTKRKARLSRYGSAIIDQKVLCTDWTQDSFYRDLWKPDKRQHCEAEGMIALFSQFQDGVMYGGYYDFVFLVAAKLCRIKDALPKDDFDKMIVSYPLFNGAYEKEYLQLLGVKPKNIVDSSKVEVTAGRIVTGNSAHWYPNLTDVMALKRHVEAEIKPVKIAANRIYISRAGRRHVTNEDELIELLKKFDFLIIEDKPRTVAEQVDIYKNASFIIGPHGASFSNIIYCEPGAHLFELFSPNYAPDFFLYLATVMDLQYSAYYEGAADSKVDYLDGLVEDVHVSIPKLEACLHGIFNAG